eukprot:TRINITY_DN9843_c0_g1_i9.p1 TRINITY_DN9843_c0_g1~~TRINITY_DN9843_c0_g1_i9.p1  ORF type:complete len:382 (-),score=80.05 TRINITY_DN9843_c0_g1_i9:184-1329(-)
MRTQDTLKADSPLWKVYGSVDSIKRCVSTSTKAEFFIAVIKARPEIIRRTMEVFFKECIRLFHTFTFYKFAASPSEEAKHKSGSQTFHNLFVMQDIEASLKKTPVLIVGVDGGGNNCRVSIETADGITLGSSCVKKPSHISLGDKTWSNIIQGIRNVIEPLGVSLSSGLELYGCFGLAGSSVPKYVNDFTANSCIKLFKSLSIAKDTEIAQAAAHNLKDGGIIIIGTGSAAFARYGGREYRSGGRGFPLSDGGSGAYIGLKAAKALIRVFDFEERRGELTEALSKAFNDEVTDLVEWGKRATPKEFSTLAPFVLKYYKDPVAQKILKQAAKKIEMLYRNIVDRMEREKGEEERKKVRTLQFALLGDWQIRSCDIFQKMYWK